MSKRPSAKEINRDQNPNYNPIVMLQEFLKMEAAGGLILVFCAVLAMLLANSSMADVYHHILHETKAIVGIGPLVLEKDIIHWINDGLMAIFFFLVGLEIKREVMEGMLSTKEQLILPIVAAIGGMVVPGLIFFYINQGDPDSLRGWAIPTATDIAFALGVLSVLGRRVPICLKVFLLALAIIDDLGAIIIIALFYTSHLDMLNLSMALVFIAGLFTLNKMNVSSGSLYLVFGVALWICVLKSGVHATLAGVVCAFSIPLHIKGERRSLLRQLEHDLNPFIAFLILPIFAFANAGVSLEGITLDVLWEPITLGVIAGLFIGKPLGITLFTWIFTSLKIAKLPTGMTMSHVLGVSLLGGIGFTMSIFIGTLGYIGHPHYLIAAKLGILTASLLSAVTGLIVLYVMRGDKIDRDLEFETENPNKPLEFHEKDLLEDLSKDESPAQEKVQEKAVAPRKKTAPAKAKVAKPKAKTATQAKKTEKKVSSTAVKAKAPAKKAAKTQTTTKAAPKAKAKAAPKKTAVKTTKAAAKAPAKKVASRTTKTATKTTTKVAAKTTASRKKTTKK